MMDMISIKYLKRSNIETVSNLLGFNLSGLCKKRINDKGGINHG
jgi:hypothetical protein